MANQVKVDKLLPNLTDRLPRQLGALSKGLLRNAVQQTQGVHHEFDGTLSLRNLAHSTKDGNKKRVGFAPEPPSYHDHHHSGTSSSFNLRKDPVQLDSNTDGLIVASVFLPVHLHRTNDGKWSADWDYEALLSMQTHLRVTRVGVVKWRGWHGNKGADGSPEGGVPESERHLVEECLRPFHCVPVWVDPSMFGEMYVFLKCYNCHNFVLIFDRYLCI